MLRQPFQVRDPPVVQNAIVQTADESLFEQRFELAKASADTAQGRKYSAQLSFRDLLPKYAQPVAQRRCPNRLLDFGNDGTKSGFRKVPRLLVCDVEKMVGNLRGGPIRVHPRPVTPHTVEVLLVVRRQPTDKELPNRQRAVARDVLQVNVDRGLVALIKRSRETADVRPWRPCGNKLWHL